MTPYATLMVRPADDDATIRRAFHALSKRHHPDKTPSQPAPKEWYAAVAAYSVIKSADGRAKHDRYMQGLSGVCAACRGSGVRGTRSAGGKLRLCDTCFGEGRVIPGERRG